MSLVDHASSFQVDFPVDVVFNAAVRASRRLSKHNRFHLDFIDDILRKIDLGAGVSLSSCGENINLIFKEFAPVKTKIEILSTPKTGVMFGGAFDCFGKNRKNIDEIMNEISLELRVERKKRSQAVAKSSSSQAGVFEFVCPHCSKILDCPPEAENVACECPACGGSAVPVRKSE